MTRPRPRPSILGLHGVAGAGKDATFERLQVLGGVDNFCRFSIADPLKESIAALFGITTEHLERIKRDKHARVELYWSASVGMAIPRKLSIREFMQRYGTESHRGIFGDDFWLDHWMQEVDRRSREATCTFVNTSVRFENEAVAIIELGGEVWQIDGPQDDGAGGHESETPLPPHLVTRTIDNSYRHFGPIQRVPDFSHLDDQVALIIDEWKSAS